MVWLCAPSPKSTRETPKGPQTTLWKLLLCGYSAFKLLVITVIFSGRLSSFLSSCRSLCGDNEIHKTFSSLLIAPSHHLLSYCKNIGLGTRKSHRLGNKEKGKVGFRYWVMKSPYSWKNERTGILKCLLLPYIENGIVSLRWSLFLLLNSQPQSRVGMNEICR